MNNIGLIISGNLTGFSHFYDSPVAKDFCVQTKFDFDYRNYITFLSTGEKLYVASFAPTVLAISLVTRILDSYRRPGILVISILIPRHKKIESVATGQSDRAVYDLLNAINNKFYERNFINGMLNQNPAVLMQDYYSDIIAGYRLVDDPMQRNVSMTVDPTLANKRCGYVKAAEADIASYLATPCRKSYEGYNDVFFAANAPQNINEPPVEVVLYNVRITNNGQRIPGARLTDKVFDLRPGEGEKDINKNYTYQQMLNGEAGGDITATVVGESLEITYRFMQEERTINFQFSDGANVVPFEQVMPIIVMNGMELNLPSESYTFRGKEIYGVKQLKSSNPNLAFKQPNLDISRIQDGGKCTILVEQSTPISFEFKAPYNKPKTITLRRKDGVVRTFNVASVLHESLPGRCEEYSYTITSDYYETVSGQLQQFLNDRHVKLTVKKPQAGSTPQKTQTESVNSFLSNKQTPTKPQGKSHSTIKNKQNDNEVIPVVTSQKRNLDFKFNAPLDSNNISKKRSNRTIMIGAVTVMVVALFGVLGFVFKDQLLGDDTEQEEVVMEVTKTVKFIVQDSSPNDFDLKKETWEKLKGNLQVICIVGKDTMEIKTDELGNVVFLTEITRNSTSTDSLKYYVVFVDGKGVKDTLVQSKEMSCFNKLPSDTILYPKLDCRFSDLISKLSPKKDKGGGSTGENSRDNSSGKQTTPSKVTKSETKLPIVLVSKDKNKITINRFQGKQGDYQKIATAWNKQVGEAQKDTAKKQSLYNIYCNVTTWEGLKEKLFPQ